jgi:hypothetical protein
MIFSIPFLLLFISSAGQQTPPTAITLVNFAGYADLVPCAALCISNNYADGPLVGAVVLETGNCGTNACLCGREPLVISWLQSCANYLCGTTDTNDVSSLTAFFVSYCSDYEAAASRYSAQVTTTVDIPSVVTASSTQTTTSIIVVSTFTTMASVIQTS